MLERKVPGIGDCGYERILYYVLVIVFCLIVFVSTGDADDVCAQQALTSFHLRNIGKSTTSKHCAELCCDNKPCDLVVKVSHRCLSINCKRNEVCDAIYDQLSHIDDDHGVKRRSINELINGSYDDAGYNEQSITERSLDKNDNLQFQAYLLHEMHLNGDDSNNSDIPKNNESSNEKGQENNFLSRYAYPFVQNHTTDSPESDAMNLIRERRSTNKNHKKSCGKMNFVDGGIGKRKKSYLYKKLSTKSSLSMASCSGKCCDLEQCIMSFLIDKSCYAVMCHGEGNCRDKKDRLPNLDFQVAMQKRETSLDDSKQPKKKHEINDSKKNKKPSHKSKTPNKKSKKADKQSKKEKKPTKKKNVKKSTKHSKPKATDKKSKEKSGAKKDTIERADDSTSTKKTSSNEYQDDINKLLDDRKSHGNLFDDATIGKTHLESSEIEDDKKKESGENDQDISVSEVAEEAGHGPSIESFKQVTGEEDENETDTKDSPSSGSGEMSAKPKPKQKPKQKSKSKSKKKITVHPVVNHHKEEIKRPRQYFLIQKHKRSHVNELLSLLKSKKIKKHTTIASKKSKVSIPIKKNQPATEDILLKKIEMIEHKLDAKKQISEEDIKKQKILEKISALEKHIDAQENGKSSNRGTVDLGKNSEILEHGVELGSGDELMHLEKQHLKSKKIVSKAKMENKHGGQNKQASTTKLAKASDKSKSSKKQVIKKLNSITESKHQSKNNDIEEKRLRLEEELMELNHIKDKKDGKSKNKDVASTLEDFELPKAKLSKKDKIAKEKATFKEGKHHDINKGHKTHAVKKELHEEDMMKDKGDSSGDGEEKKSAEKSGKKSNNDHGSGDDEFSLFKEFEELQRKSHKMSLEDTGRYGKDFIMHPNKNDVEKYKVYASSRHAEKKAKQEQPLKRKLQEKKLPKHHQLKKKKTLKKQYREMFEGAGSGDESSGNPPKVTLMKRKKEKLHVHHIQSNVNNKKSIIKHSKTKKMKISLDELYESGSGEEILKELIKERIMAKLGGKRKVKKKSTKKAKIKTAKIKTVKKTDKTDKASKRTQNTKLIRNPPIKITEMRNNVTKNKTIPDSLTPIINMTTIPLLPVNQTIISNQTHVALDQPSSQQKILHNVSVIAPVNHSSAVTTTPRPKTPSRPKMTTVHVDGEPTKKTTPTPKPKRKTTPAVIHDKKINSAASPIQALLLNDAKPAQDARKMPMKTTPTSKQNVKIAATAKTTTKKPMHEPAKLNSLNHEKHVTKHPPTHKPSHEHHMKIPTLSIITNDEDPITKVPTKKRQKPTKHARKITTARAENSAENQMNFNMPGLNPWQNGPVDGLGPLQGLPLSFPSPHMESSHLVTPLSPYYNQAKPWLPKSSTAGTLGDIQLQEPGSVDFRPPIAGQPDNGIYPPFSAGLYNPVPTSPQPKLPLHQLRIPMEHPQLHGETLPQLTPRKPQHQNPQFHESMHILPKKTPVHVPKAFKPKPLMTGHLLTTPRTPTRSHIQKLLGLLGVTISPDELGTRSSVASRPTKPMYLATTESPAHQHHGKSSPEDIIERILGNKNGAETQSPGHKQTGQKHRGKLEDFFNDDSHTSQDNAKHTKPHHPSHGVGIKVKLKNPHPLPGKVMTGGKKKTVPVKPASCPTENTETNVILSNGIKAGRLKKVNDNKDFASCVDKCCQQPSCNAAMESGNGCFLVECHSRSSCHTEKSTDPIIQTKFLFLRRINNSSHPQALPMGSCSQHKALGMMWSATQAGSATQRECPREANGMAKRQCSERGHWFPPDFSACVSNDYKNLNDKLKELGYSTSIKEMSSRLEDITSQTIDNSFLFGGDIAKSVHIMSGIARFAERSGTEQIEFKDFKNYVRSASNLLDDTNRLEWENVKHVTKGPTQLMKALDEFGGYAASQLKPKDRWQPLVTNNLVMMVHKLVGGPNSKKYTFPDYSHPGLKTWTTKQDTIVLPATLFHRGVVRLSSIHYKTLPHLLPHRWNTTNHVTFTDGFKINSKVIATSLYPRPLQKITPPVTIILHHIKTAFSSKAKCVFWDFRSNPESGGSWSTEGCWVVLSNSSLTICQCEHLTHFAVLTHLVDDKISAKEQTRENTFAIMWLGIPVTIVVVLGAMYSCFAWSKAPRRKHTVFVDKKPRLPDDDVIVTRVVKEHYTGSPAKNLFAANQTPSPSDLEWEHAWDFLTNCNFEPMKKEAAKRVIRELDEKRRLGTNDSSSEGDAKDPIQTSEYFSESDSSYLKWKHQDDFEWSRERIKCLNKGMITVDSSRPQPADSLEECINASLDDDQEHSDQSFDMFSPDAISSPNACSEKNTNFHIIKHPDAETIKRQLFLVASDSENSYPDDTANSSLDRIRELLDRDQVRKAIEILPSNLPVKTPNCSSRSSSTISSRQSVNRRPFNLSESEQACLIKPKFENLHGGHNYNFVKSSSEIRNRKTVSSSKRAVPERRIPHKQTQKPTSVGLKRKHSQEADLAKNPQKTPLRHIRLRSSAAVSNNIKHPAHSRLNRNKGKQTDRHDGEIKGCKTSATNCRKSIESMKSSCSEKQGSSTAIARLSAASNLSPNIRMSPSRHMHSYIELRQQSQKLELDCSTDVSSDNNTVTSPIKRVRFSQCTIISTPTACGNRTRTVKRLANNNSSKKQINPLPKAKLDSFKNIKSAIDHNTNYHKRRNVSAREKTHGSTTKRLTTDIKPHVVKNYRQNVERRSSAQQQIPQLRRPILRLHQNVAASKFKRKIKMDSRSTAESRVFGTRLQRWKASNKLSSLINVEPEAKRRAISDVSSSSPRKSVRWRF